MAFGDFFLLFFIPKFGEDGWSQRVRRAFGHPNSEEDLFGENSLPPEPTDILYVEFSTVSRIESSLFAPDFLWRDCFFFVFFFGASFGSPRNAQCDIFCLPICWCWWLKARNIWGWWIYGMPSSLPSEPAISHRTAMGQIPRSPVGFIRHLGEVWGSCGSQQQILKFPKSHWCQNLMSQISWKTLMLGRFFPTGFPTPNLRIWLKRWANRRDNTVAIFDMFQLKKACFLSRINRTRIVSDEKPPMIVPASPRFAPQIPILNHKGIWAEIRLRIQDSESPACPSNMALLFASYLCWVSFLGGEV